MSRRRGGTPAGEFLPAGAPSPGGAAGSLRGSAADQLHTAPLPATAGINTRRTPVSAQPPGATPRDSADTRPGSLPAAGDAAAGPAASGAAAAASRGGNNSPLPPRAPALRLDAARLDAHTTRTSRVSIADVPPRQDSAGDRSPIASPYAAPAAQRLSRSDPELRTPGPPQQAALTAPVEFPRLLTVRSGRSGLGGFQSCCSGDGGDTPVDDASTEAAERHRLLAAASPPVIVRKAEDWAQEQQARAQSLSASPAALGGARCVAAPPARGGGVPLLFDGLNITRRVRGGRRRRQALLRDVCGVARPGELTAVLGSDERGADALMAILSGQTLPGDFDGVVRAGSVPSGGPGSPYHAVVGHVSQQPVCLASELTVRQNLRLTLLLRDRNPPKNRVSSVLRLSGLTDDQENHASDLSAEKCLRLAIALELLTDPPVLCVEYPTRSLDVGASLATVRLLSRLAKDHHKTVVVSLHQPRWAVYSLVDRLLLLHGGQMAYLGPAGEEAMTFFQDRGWVWDRQYTPTDFLLQLSLPQRAQEGGDDVAHAGHAASSPVGVTADALAQVFRNSPEYEAQLRPELDQLLEHGAAWDRGAVAKSPSEVYRSLILFKVAVLRQWRWWRWNVAHVLVVLIFGTVAGKIYDSLEVSQRGMQNRVGLSFFILFLLMLANVPYGMATLESRPRFLKHWTSGYYRVTTYWFVTVLWDQGVQGLCTLVFSVIVFYLTNFDSTSDLGSFVGVITITQMSFAGLAFCIGVWAPTEDAAMTALFAALTFFTLSGGLLVNSTSIPDWLSWIQYLSLMRYGYESMLVNMFHGQPFDCNLTSPEPSASPTVMPTMTPDTSPPSQAPSDVSAAAHAVLAAVADLVPTLDPTASPTRSPYAPGEPSRSPITSPPTTSPTHTPTVPGFNDGCYTGDGYLDLLGFKVGRKWLNIYVLVGILAGLLLVSLLGLHRRRWRGRWRDCCDCAPPS